MSTPTIPINFIPSGQFQNDTITTTVSGSVVLCTFINNGVVAMFVQGTVTNANSLTGFGIALAPNSNVPAQPFMTDADFASTGNSNAIVDFYSTNTNTASSASPFQLRIRPEGIGLFTLNATADSASPVVLNIDYSYR